MPVHRTVQAALFSANVLLASLLLTRTIVRAQSDEPSTPALQKPVAPKLLQAKPWHSSASQRSMIGGLWMTDPNYRSVLYVKNDVITSRLSVTPVLYLSNGAKYTLPPIQLDRAGTAVVNIDEALTQLGIASWASLYGYVELQYSRPWDALCVTIRNLDVIHSEQFNFGLLPSGSNQTGNPPRRATGFEGLWWKQEQNVTGFVAVSDLSNEPRTVAIQVTGRSANLIAEHSVTVSPHGTKLVQLDELKSIAATDGGLHITWTGESSDVIVNGGMEDQSVGYSANIPFTFLVPDPQTGISRRYAQIGFMTGIADPMMQFPAGTVFTRYSSFRNVSDEPISVTPKLFWTQAGAPKSAKVPSLTLPPRTSFKLDMASALQNAGLSNYSGTLDIVLDVQGPRFAFLAASGSVDKKSTYVFGVSPQAIIESVAKSLSYWSTANGDDTLVTLWNPADEAQDFLFTLFFTGAQYALPLHLEPKATRSFNLSEIISNQIPDAQGRTVPASVHEGSAILSGPQGENEHILVAFDAGHTTCKKRLAVPTAKPAPEHLTPGWSPTPGR